LRFAYANIILQKGMQKTHGDNGVFITMLINVSVLALVFFIFRVFTGDFVPFDATGFFFYVLAGFLTTFMGRVALFSAIRHIGSSRAVVIKNTAPLFTVVFAV